MKVIDLLNKIANGEEVPDEIKIGDDYYYRNIRADVVRIDFLYREKETTELWLDYGNIHLNDEVEIIEEDKKIEQINMKYYQDEPALICDLAHKVYEIIDYLDKE